jgi:hypothetical protein
LGAKQIGIPPASSACLPKQQEQDLFNRTVPTKLQLILVLGIVSALLISGCAKGGLTAGGGPTPTPTPGGPGPTPSPTPAPGAHSVSVTWSASTTSGLAGYNVYRGTVSGGPYSRVTSTPTTALQFTDSAVTAGQTYFYVVTAVGGNGVESVTSNEMKVTVPTP